MRRQFNCSCGTKLKEGEDMCDKCKPRAFSGEEISEMTIEQYERHRDKILACLARDDEAAESQLSTQDKLKEILKAVSSKMYGYENSFSFDGREALIYKGGGAWVTLTFKDLLLNGEAMKALFGEELVCSNCGTANEKNYFYCQGCLSENIGETGAFLHHGLKAAEFYLKNQQDTAIDYLWKEIKR